MLVYKFGGSVLKDAEGIRALPGVVRKADEPLILVVSAFGKTTNALERIAGLSLKGDSSVSENIQRLKNYHEEIISELFPDRVYPVVAEVEELFHNLEGIISLASGADPDAWYDRIVSYGELFSYVIVNGFLSFSGITAHRTDIRQVIITDDRFRGALVDFEETTRRVQRAFVPEKGRLYITQGYISATVNGTPTTLGREGSDYTAAILGSILGASTVVLWKDVPGVMNADPKIDSEAKHITAISYQEAAEMAFYGAKVIHPKTIKPLQNKHIRLMIRSLHELRNPGTIIWDFETMEHRIPVFIRKDRQILLSVFPRDYSFILNRHLESLTGLFNRWKFNITLIQISAISVSLCIDDPGERFMEKVSVLQQDFEVYFNRGVEMITFRHYSDEDISFKLQDCDVLIEQRTRLTAQFVVRYDLSKKRL